MSGKVPASDVAQLALLIEEISGNVIPPGHYPFLADVAGTRAREHKLRDVRAYSEALARGALRGEWEHLLPLITIKESYFFRTPQHFRAIAETILPEIMRARAATRRMRVWSAGCSRGEESATLALVLGEHAGLAGWDWRVVATDVDQQALADARRGVYGERAVAQTPPELLRRHFTFNDGEFEFSAALRAHIDYRPFNLIREPFEPPVEPYDLILLRNVLIYFRPESQRRVVTNMAASLAPHGALFLGPAETLWQISTGLVPVDLGDCFYYRHRRATDEPRHPLPRVAAAPARAPRVNRPRGPAAPHPHAPVAPTSQPIQSAPTRAPVGLALPTTDVLRDAAAHLAANRIEEGVTLVQEALQTNPSNPGAHALEGFCHDLAGRTEMAIASYRAALFLDAELYQIRLLLADALRRLGWRERAEREYREVLGALERARGRELDALTMLPVPDRTLAEKRCREALRRP